MINRDIAEIPVANRHVLTRRTFTAGIVLFLMASALSLVGCENSPTTAPYKTLPTCKMTIGSKTYELEMARTSDEQETGLMKRDTMPEDHGMIFIFQADRLQQFWMKDTRIPLDIIFVDHSGRVVSVSTMQPYDLNTTSSIEPAQYAIELNAGQAKAAGVEKGNTLKIPDAALYKGK
jgi:uncharacterized membrane protein (UPF0127 family)